MHAAAVCPDNAGDHYLISIVQDQGTTPARNTCELNERRQHWVIPWQTHHCLTAQPGEPLNPGLAGGIILFKGLSYL